MRCTKQATLLFSRWVVMLGVIGLLNRWLATCAVIHVITKLQYKKAGPASMKQLTGLLGYLQHRRDVADGDDLPRTGRRWTNVGLGNSTKEIRANCQQQQSPHVLAFTWVVAPNTDCIALIEPTDHKRFVSELTERSVEGLFEARDMPVPDYSYIYHVRETEDQHAPHRLNPHAHIILAGTYNDPLEGVQPYYMNKSRKRGEDHPDLFWKVAESAMDQLMERYVGLDWPKRLEALLAEREKEAQDLRDYEIQQRLTELVHSADSALLQHVERAPDCWGESQAGLLWRGWVAVHPTGSERHEVGVHWQADDLLANPEDTFEPLLTDLSDADAQERKRQLLEALAREPTKGIEVLYERAAELQPALPEQSTPGVAGRVDDDFSIGMDWSL